MQRLWRVGRLVPRQPNLSILNSRIAHHIPPRVRCLASVANLKTADSSASASPDSISAVQLPTTGSQISRPAQAASTNIIQEVVLGKAVPQPRFNEIDVQHISDQLHDQIFGKNATSPSPDLVELSKQHLELHNLLGKVSKPTEAIGFDLPPLHSKQYSLDEHFFKLGTYTAQPWLDIAKEFAAEATKLPAKPTEWNLKESGWTRYGSDGTQAKVEYPEDNMLVFDVEVLWKVSPYAVLACAASPTAWYSWISPEVIGDSDHDKHLIPLGDGTMERIVVGHNVSYDRARIKEEYNLQQTKTFFLDTMSLHAAVNGMCSRQRPTWMKNRKDKQLRQKLMEGATPELAGTVENVVDDTETELWIEKSSINSLRDVAMFHTKVVISKETRDEMSEMKGVEELRNDAKLRQCLDYCASDVAVTHEVFKKVLGAFLVTCPHPVSFSALRHMGSLLLPVNTSWTSYVTNAENTYMKLLEQVNSHLKALTEETVSICFETPDTTSRNQSRPASDISTEKPSLTKKARRELENTIKDALGQEERLKAEILELEKLAAEKRAAKEAKGKIYKTTPKSAHGVNARKTEISSWQKKREAARAELEGKAPETVPATLSAPSSVRTPTSAHIEDIERNPWSGKNAWLSQLDWSGREIKYRKQKDPTDPLVPVARQKLPGYPAWYKGLFPKSDAPMNMSVRIRAAPLMLQLQWDGYPLVWTDKYGWTFRVPNKDLHKYEDSPMVRCEQVELLQEPNCNVAMDNNAVYFKLPHNGNGSTRCVNPLAKGYQRYFESGVLTSAYPQAKEALEMNAACSYWISARERIKSQFVVWEKDLIGNNGKGMGFDEESKSTDLGLILPQIVTMGTITRRAVENTWLTASNAKSNRVGSELKAMIKAPPGYCFVGADVDSEELWIASLIGDAEFKMHGGNAIGFMTLEGTKAAGTDMHSRTAKTLNISRDSAKIFNYGRIYGAGLKFAANLLRQFNPNVNEAEADRTAQQLYKETKGTKTTRKALTDQRFWHGGTESFVFNKLEQFAEQDQPRTPVLGAGITEALRSSNINKGSFLTSRINWAIQSSGVDYLHLLIVSMDYLIRQYGLNARLMITVHDEIRYIVEDDDKYKVAMALQIANLWTRAMFSQQMGINDLPQSCAFFSAVDIDTVLRKEVDLKCITPSHPNAIPPGESLDIQQLLKKPEAQLHFSENDEARQKIDDIKYDARIPVMEELAESSGSNKYFMRAQIAQTTSQLGKVMRDLENEAPELKKAIPSRYGTKADQFAWNDEDSEVEIWGHLSSNLGVTTLQEKFQKLNAQCGGKGEYGWEFPVDVTRKPQTPRKKLQS